jgi:hypothetical protein
MDTRFIANLIRISLKLETEKDFSLSDKVDNLLKTAQYAGQFDRTNPYTDGMFGVQVSGSSPTAFGPYQGPGNDVPFISELDPMTKMKLQHTKGTKPGQSAFLDALERVTGQEQLYRITPVSILRILATTIKTMASDPSRRDNYFTKELESNIRQVMNTIKKSKTDPTVTDDALKSFYNELQIFNSKNPNDLIPIDEITDMIENSK